MEKSLLHRDPFIKRIREILARTSQAKESIRGLIFAEVQNYSREVQEKENTSVLFLRLCELFVDCESLAIPDESFKIVIAKLLHECSDSKTPFDQELRELLGVDATGLEEAMEYFKSKECFVLEKDKTGGKGKKRINKSDPQLVNELEESV